MRTISTVPLLIRVLIMEGKRDIFYLPMNSLLYLLYKKLILGAEFSLSPFKKILHDSIPFNDKIIDKEWRK